MSNDHSSSSASGALTGKLVYLATPYRNYAGGPDQAFRDACKLAAKLIPAGVFVFCPISHGHPIARFGSLDPHDMAIWGPHNAVMLAHCDVLAVAQLPGWDESEGIAGEIEIFDAANKPIYDLDPRSLVMTRRPWLRPVRERHDARADEELTAERDSYLNQAMR